MAKGSGERHWRWRDLPLLLAAAGLYALLGRAALYFQSPDGLATIFWPGSGVGLVFVLLGGRRYALAVFLGALGAHLWIGTPAAESCALALASMIEPLFGCWLLRREASFDYVLATPRAFYRLATLAGLLAPAPTAVLGVAVQAAFGGVAPVDLGSDLALWWMGDTLGIVLVGSLLLVWRRPPEPRPGLYAEGAIVLVLTLLVGSIVFLGWMHERFGQISYAYWLYLLVTWAAMRLGTHGLVLTLLIVTVQALTGAATGVGFFGNDLGRAHLANFWAFTTILTVVGMSLAAQLEERRNVERALRRREADLRESEERLQLFIEHAPAALAMFDSEMRYVAVSRRWISDYGLDAGSVLGRSHYEVFPEIPSRWREVHRRSLAGEVVRAEDDSFTRADGSMQWLRWEVRPWSRADGEIGGIVIFTEDVSARKLAELALAESEAQYRAVIETAADGFWIVDTEGKLCATNEAYSRRSGYTREELLGMPITVLEAQESPEETAQHVARVRQRGNDRFETLHRTKSGEIWPVEVTVSYWTAAGGRFFAFVRDISERRRIEAELQALHAEMEQLTRFQVASQTAAAIAHELNQPLNAVAAYASAALRLLRLEPPQPEKLRHALEAGEQQAQRAGRVMRELVAYLSHGEVETECFDLNMTIGEVVARSEFDAAGARFRVELEPSLPPVRANRLQVEKVLHNLIENGIEAMRGSGDRRLIAIRVHSGSAAGMAQVSVSDRGPGIAEDIREHIFKPFFTTKPKGLGMGLAISRSIIEANGGQLWVDADAGGGASFHFTLPFAA